ncbi:MAG: YkgJ family cysteine cluster protein [Bacteroidales bacterium]|jgi:Fe-S-cluster containining protein|nr:YkgJ family cysteine cluster protein [Bacteroidales bacterium]
MAIYKNIETEIDKIEKLRKLRKKENIDFRIYLKGQAPHSIDEIVYRLNVEISKQIDCTSCGNCCMKLTPAITELDIKSLSRRLNLEPQQIKDDYLEMAEGEQYFKHLPCVFLKEKKCTIYNDRPEACSSFLHLHKKKFTSRLWGVIDNYSICPIVFNVFENLKTELNYK